MLKPIPFLPQMVGNKLEALPLGPNKDRLPRQASLQKGATQNSKISCYSTKISYYVKTSFIS